MMDETDHRPPRRSYWTPAIAGIILFALALRVFYAWTMQYMGNEDHCLVALMAKHMAEGRDFPVFFYGQPYMGSLEPAVSAVLVWLFGPTTFMVYLGTALTGLLVLPLLYLFGHDTDSRWAGLLAMVYVTIMPEFVTYFFIVPRGGYMTMMVTGIAALWLACRIATSVRAGRRVSPWTYAALGVVAGLGWWSNQLVIAFLITACIVLLIAFRPNMLAGVLPGLLGFVLGGLPWWLWNITHQWGSFDFAGTFGKVELDEGMQSLWQQFLVLAGFDPIAPWWAKVRAALFLCVLVAYAAIIVRDRARKEDAGRFYFRAALPILVIVMVLLYARSHYARFNGAHRYLLPILPALAVMAGVVCSRIVTRKSVAAGILLFAAILPAYTPGLQTAWRTMLAERVTFKQSQEVADELAPLCDGVALGDWVRYHWMNFSSGEKLCVARLPNERYAPYAIRAELAERPAVLGDFKRFRTFLEATRSSSKQGGVERFPYDYDIRPPSNNWTYADSSQIESATDSSGRLALDAVSDLCMDSGWSGQVDRKTNIVATFTFRKPLPICGVRFLSLSERYPTYMTIQGQRRSGPEWQTLFPHQRATCWFWSGRYAQVDGLQYFQELRFAAPKAGVKRLTITFDVGDADIPYPFDIAEIRFLQETPRPATSEWPDVTSCIAALDSAGTQRFYAPRWLAARVWAAAPDRFDTTVPGNLKRTVNDLTARDTTIPEPVVIRGVTSFICDRRDAEATRSVLKSRGFEWKETGLDQYVLITLTGPAELLRADHPSTMYWTELGCFRMDNARSAKENADWLHRRRLEQPEGAADRLDGLRQVIRLYPGHQPARKMLAAELEKAGFHAEAEQQAAELRRQTVPQISAPMKFSDSVEFLGLTLSSRDVPRGGKLVIQYYWRCPPAVLRKKLPAVFVHFANGGEMFQDDHRVLGTADRKEIEFQPFDEVLVETRAVSVPSSAAPGEYEIRMGRKSRIWRSAVDTELPQSRRAVELPVRLTVVP